MKKFTLGLIAVMGLMVASAVAALADSGFSGNQLMKRRRMNQELCRNGLVLK